jgi:hypothetical protein
MTSVSYGPLREGQQQAIGDLLSIARRSNGALAVASDWALVDGVLNVHVDLSAASLRSSDQGIALRDWEPIDLKIYDDFPLSPPIAWAGRDDFPELPHQARGSGFCLRVEPNNWDHATGITGFMQAVIDTYQRIALGTLEGHLQPWRPLVGYTREGCAVIRADLPAVDIAREESLFCWTLGIASEEDRIDIMGWLRLDGDTGSSWAENDVVSNELEEINKLSSNAFLMPAIVVPKPIAMEYFHTWGELLLRLEEQGIDGIDFLIDLARIISIKHRSSSEEQSTETPPCGLIFRLAADTKKTAEDHDARFAVARFSAEDIRLASAVSTGVDSEESLLQSLEDFVAATVPWVQVYDGRPDSVRRRAKGRPAEKLADAKIMVLGAGGLGAPIAEHCVRAGAEFVHIMDSGSVSPGILSRQPYEDADIGKFKAAVIAARLGRIRPETEVAGSVVDVIRSGVLDTPRLAHYDLIIDATANRSVAAVIERSRRRNLEWWPTLVTLAISQQATHGVAAVTPRGAIGAGIDLLRRLGLETSNRALQDVHTAFFPPAAQRLNFHPDPTCSDPTFVGSTTDIAALAAQLLDSAAARIDKPDGQTDTGVPSRSLTIVRLGVTDESKPARVALDLQADRVITVQEGNWEIRLQESALEIIRGHTRESAVGQTPGAGRTAGLLVGQFENVCRIAWVSYATSLTPGSSVDPFDFRLDDDEVIEFLDDLRKRSDGLLTPVGFWRTHLGDPTALTDAERKILQKLISSEQWRVPQALLLDVSDLGDVSTGDPAQPWMPSFRAEILVN